MDIFKKPSPYPSNLEELLEYEESLGKYSEMIGGAIEHFKANCLPKKHHDEFDTIIAAFTEFTNYTYLSGVSFSRLPRSDQYKFITVER